MTKSSYVEIAVVLDRSGSMEVVRNDTMGGFNAFVKDQQSQTAGEVKLSLVQFDDKYEINYDGKPIKDVPALTAETYVPRGMTALLDAVGRTINTVGERLAKMSESERPSVVIFVIITDGQENASKEFKLDQVKEMIKHQTEKYNWQFVFLGADQNAFQAEQMGVAASNTYNYKSANTIGTYTNLSRGISNLRDVADAAESSMDFMIVTSAASSIGDFMRQNDVKKDKDDESTPTK